MQDIFSPKDAARWPLLIQGGMGVYISGWRLAKAVAVCGGLGTVSLVGIEQVWFSRIRNNNLDEIERLALKSFPDQSVVAEIRQYCNKYQYPPKWGYPTKSILVKLAILASYCEVWCAKAGHTGQIAVNLMVKVQLPTLYYLDGSLLAGVDCIVAGAGIPTQFPRFINSLIQHQETTQRLIVNSKESDQFTIVFNPSDYVKVPLVPLKRPRFGPIISHHALGQRLAKIKRSDGTPEVDFFIVENSNAGGHVAPNRTGETNPISGEPIYGPRDVCDLSVLQKVGLPYYLAGGYGTHSMLKQAREQGASGVQVGTPFAFCNESAMRSDYKFRLLEEIAADKDFTVFTSGRSPAGYPFQVPQVSWIRAFTKKRLCDIGLLLEPVCKEGGILQWVCAGEPLDHYLEKLGKAGMLTNPEDAEAFRKETLNKICLCNGLLALTDFGRTHKGIPEPPAATIGKKLGPLYHFLNQGIFYFSAADVYANIVRDLV